MQHSWEYVLEAHILNTKLTTDLENDRKLLKPEEKRVSEQGKNQSLCIPFDVVVQEDRTGCEAQGNWAHFGQSRA